MADVAATPVTGPRECPPQSRTMRWFIRPPPAVTFLLVVIVCIVVGTIIRTSGRFPNLFDMARSTVVRGLFALGVLVVLASGGSTVSFTAIAALVMYVITMLVTNYAPDLSIWRSLHRSRRRRDPRHLQRLVVHALKAPSLIVTIGTPICDPRVSADLHRNGTVHEHPESWTLSESSRFYGTRGEWCSLDLPAYFLVLVVAALATWYILKRTLIGRLSMRLAETPVSLASRIQPAHCPRVRLCLCGLLAGIAGIHARVEQSSRQPFRFGGVRSWTSLPRSSLVARASPEARVRCSEPCSGYC